MTDTKAAALAAAVERLTDAMVTDRPKHWMDVDDVCTLIDGFRTQAARIAELEAERAGLVAAERERCAALCSKAMLQPVANWSDAQIVEALRLVREAILSTEAKP